MADRTGISDKTVSNWETGPRKPGLKNAAKLAKALGCSLHALMDESEAGSEAARPMQALSSSDAVEIRGMAEIPERERQKLVDLFVALVALYRHKRRDFDAAERVIASFTGALPAGALPERATTKARGAG